MAENLVKFGRVVSDKQTDTLITILRPLTWDEVKNSLQYTVTRKQTH